ncbi:MAG: hypothetical protein KC416_07705, partial [Myxococcales bacterium]|nr:hypothetical protein [Myxococcales bacterium]
MATHKRQNQSTPTPRVPGPPLALPSGMATRHPQTPDTLFNEYIGVVNRAIDTHQNQFPFQQMLKVGEKLTKDRKFGAAVYKDSPEHPHDYFTISFDGHKLNAERGKDAPALEWKVKQEYLENVVSHPDEYVKNPLKLDLNWVKSRLQQSFS